jgi:hypothetical protein
MLMIFVLGLIAKLVLVSSDCNVGTQDVKNFDWSKVCIVVLTRFLKQEAFKTARLILYFIFGSIKKYSIDCIRIYFRVIERFMDNYMLMISKYSLGF